MVVLILIVLSLGVVGFIMLSDTRKNNNFKQLEQKASGHVPAVTVADSSGDAGDGGSAGSD